MAIDVNAPSFKNFRNPRRLAIFLVGFGALGGVLPAQKPAAQEKQKPIPISKYKGTKDRDIEIGKQYAAQVEKEMKIVPNEELTAYINRVGKRLVSSGLLDRDFPYTFKVVQEPSINAFALPGGPMFVHTGLIAAAENEAQLAGVLAHELAHVSLRHGVANASKQQTISTIGGLGAGILGGMLGGSLGDLAAQGAQMGTQAWVSKYSRSAESEADLLGEHVMAKAGYNPLELGNFFEKLEKSMGGDPGRVAQWFSSHPNPGNRTVAIQSQLPYVQTGPYNTREGDLDRMRKIVQGLPALPKGGGGQKGAPKGVPANSPVPEFQISQNLRQLNAGGLTISVPDNWQAANDEQSKQLMILPDGGVIEGGGIGAGILVSTFQPRQATTLDAAHNELLQSLNQQNQGQFKPSGAPQQVKVNGRNALMSRITSPSPYKDTQERDVVISVGVQKQLLYFIFIAPESRWSQFEPVYSKVIQSVRISGQ